MKDQRYAMAFFRYFRRDAEHSPLDRFFREEPNRAQEATV
jgi:hypothetical protein